MQDDTLFDSTRNELLERLKALEGPQASGSLAELAYRRAREALEKALDEARTIRLQAIDDARNHREREMTALAESLDTLRRCADLYRGSARPPVSVIIPTTTRLKNIRTG